MKRTGLGVEGENFAAEYLTGKGYIICARNFTSRFGEIDIVAIKDGFLCFVEVKTRGKNPISPARESVTLSKQKKIIKTAEYYIFKHQAQILKQNLQPRFDCIEVYVGAQGSRDTQGIPYEINHFENAFNAF